MANILHKELSYRLINMAYTIHNVLGPGLLEPRYRSGISSTLTACTWNGEGSSAGGSEGLCIIMRELLQRWFLPHDGDVPVKGEVENYD